MAKLSRRRDRPKAPPPPPGLGSSRDPKPSKLQKTAAEILAPADTLDDSKQKVTEVVISPGTCPSPVEKITKPQPESEKEVAARLKQQVPALNNLSHRKHSY